MSKLTLGKVCGDAIAQIENNIAEFKQKLDAGTSNPDKFITFSEIEEMWHTLNNSTNKTYSDMISAYLSDIDEKEVIKLKKDNAGSSESG